jgi:hypothetical protein
VTVSVAAFEVIPEKFAVIVVVPSARDVASPFEPGVLLMVATPVSEEFQVTDDVRSSVVLSEKVPVAMNGWVCPRAMLWFAGVTAIDSSTGAVTVSVTELEVTLENVAVMFVLPSATAVANPVLLMVAIVVLDELQIADAVKFCVLLQAPDDNVPVAVNCCIVPLGILALTGATAIDDTSDEVSVAVPVTPS